MQKQGQDKVSCCAHFFIISTQLSFPLELAEFFGAGKWHVCIIYLYRSATCSASQKLFIKAECSLCVALLSVQNRVSSSRCEEVHVAMRPGGFKPDSGQKQKDHLVLQSYFHRFDTKCKVSGELFHQKVLKNSSSYKREKEKLNSCCYL